MARPLQESFFAIGEGLCSGVRQKVEVEGLWCGDAGMWCYMSGGVELVDQASPLTMAWSG